MSFTAEEKVKLRHHMGYLNVSQVSTFQLGVPAAVETQFLIETAMNKVLPEAEGIVRQQMARLDCIEQQMVCDLELLAVKQIESIQINPDEMARLRREYRHHQRTLGNMLGVVPNPFDQRFPNAINMSVQGV